MLPLEISPREVKEKLDTGEKVHLVDVREPIEFSLSSIEGAEQVPLRTVPQVLPSIQERAREGSVVIFCHHGIRSLQVAAWLRQRGIANAQSMQGGIDLWSVAIDPGVPRY